jgi:large subunit ribosomal protein L28
MSRVCEVTGKRPMVGHKVSHSNIKTLKRNLPNIQSHRFWSPAQNKFVTLKVSAAGIKIINKRGIDTVLKEIRARELAAR